MAKNWNKIKSTWDAVKQNNNSLKETKQQRYLRSFVRPLSRFSEL